MPEMKDVVRADYSSRAAKIKAITTELENSLKDLFDSEKYKAYLNMMGKLHHYSANNCLLIMLQKPDAEMIAGMTTWNKEFKRYVNKGEKGILVLAPAPYKKVVDAPDVDAEGKQIQKADGTYATHKETITVEAYKPVYVYDVSQTHGDPIPELQINELEGETADYYRLFTAIASAAPCEVVFEDITSGAKGYYDSINKRIAIKTGMSQRQTLKTLAHEVFHSILHDRDVLKATGEKKDRHTMEVEAESCAYSFSSYFGIDTSEYSFNYIAGWSQGKDVSVLRESMETIRKATADLIDKVEENLGLVLSEKLTETEVLSKAMLVAV